MEIKRIHWQETIPIRHKFLWPREQPEFCHVEGDAQAWHFGGFVNEQLVSVGSVYPHGECARLRKFATITEYQGKGIGSKLLAEVFSTAKKNGVVCLWCNARESAISFYERFGMKPKGNKFFKETVPYYKLNVELK